MAVVWIIHGTVKHFFHPLRHGHTEGIRQIFDPVIEIRLGFVRLAVLFNDPGL